MSEYRSMRARRNALLRIQSHFMLYLSSVLISVLQFLLHPNISHCFPALIISFFFLSTRAASQAGGAQVSDRFPRRPWPPFRRTACSWRMSSEVESGLAALRLPSSSRGMTALWFPLWLSLLLPLCVAAARLPTAEPTGRTRASSTHVFGLLGLWGFSH